MFKLVRFIINNKLKLAILIITTIISCVQSQQTIQIQRLASLFTDPECCSCETTHPSPNSKDQPWWMSAHNENIEIIQDTSTEEEEIDIDIVFYGDSITQWWVQKNENREIFDKYFSKCCNYDDDEDTILYKGVGLGIASDTTGNLLWRIDNGEMPNSLRSKIWWVLIGTNDFYYGPCYAEDVSEGIINVLNYIQEKSNQGEYIVINSIFPRGDQGLEMMEEIKKTNEILSNYISSIDNDYIRYFELWDEWLLDNNTVNDDLMPDLLHPSVDGYDLWGSKIVSFIQSLE